MTTEPTTPDPVESPPPLHSQHSVNFPELLQKLGATLLITTYQAGKLVIVRNDAGRLNTHFRSFPSPMGMALDPRADRLAIGTTTQIWQFVNVPSVAARLEPPGSHDGCYLPRSSHFTGNIQIHEMAYGSGGQLHIVNTRFSCLCTIDPSASFIPGWRPPFVSVLEPSDRCHLNGLALVNQQPRFVTALGETNEPAGWRENKARGGIVMDIASNSILCRGLSMPHSPRWYANRLWLCESGAGTFGYLDHQTGQYRPIAHLPGFTRGLDFVGNFAFVGLSQVRESAVFSGIPITDRLTPEQRTCGLCVIDLTTGQMIALLRFEGGVQEIFAVTLLLGKRFPDLINEDQKLLENSFVVPDEWLPQVADTVRAR